MTPSSQPSSIHSLSLLTLCPFRTINSKPNSTKSTASTVSTSNTSATSVDFMSRSTFASRPRARNYVPLTPTLLAYRITALLPNQIESFLHLHPPGGTSPLTDKDYIAALTVKLAPASPTILSPSTPSTSLSSSPSTSMLLESKSKNGTVYSLLDGRGGGEWDENADLRPCNAKMVEVARLMRVLEMSRVAVRIMVLQGRIKDREGDVLVREVEEMIRRLDRWVEKARG